MVDQPIAVCSWSLRPDGPADLVEKVAATGLQAVQLALNPLVEDAARWADLSARLADAGIRINSGMMAAVGEDYTTLETIAATGGLRPDATWAENRARAEAVAAVAVKLGLDLVTFHAGFLPESPDDPERGVLMARLAEIATIFTDNGVDLGLETGQESAETLEDVLLELDNSHVGVNFDPANMILYGKGEPVAALRSLAPFVRQIHIKDALPATEPGKWGTEVVVGTGAVDWAALFVAAVSCPYRPEFVIEREGGDDRVADVCTAADVVRRAGAAP